MAQKLVAAGGTASVPSAQRLGYLLERGGAEEQAAALKSCVKNASPQTVPLLPGADINGATRNLEWKLAINTDVEAEI